MVQQSTDFKLPGRHLGLELTRTYSNAGWSSAGPLGGGWALNYAAGVFPAANSESPQSRLVGW